MAGDRRRPGRNGQIARAHGFGLALGLLILVGVLGCGDADGLAGVPTAQDAAGEVAEPAATPYDSALATPSNPARVDRSAPLAGAREARDVSSFNIASLRQGGAAYGFPETLSVETVLE